MSDPSSDVNEALCWQCGAPADPECACTEVLVAWASELKDGLGYPVVRGSWQDYVRVRIPRCEACRNRNWTCSLLVIAGLLVGVAVGVGYSSSEGWMALIGGVIGLALSYLGILLYQRLSGQQWIASDDYPPLKRLRQAGWTDRN